jgi:hypothetical protein
VYALQGNVWAFLCMVKAMSMDIIELSMPLFLLHILYSILVAFRSAVWFLMLSMIAVTSTC